MGRGKVNQSLAVILILTAAFSSLALSATGIAFAQQSSGDWPMFQDNPAHTGEGTGNPVLAPTLLWNYTAPEMSVSVNPGSGESELTPSPFLDVAVADDALYVGCANGNIYALNATNGTELWRYATNGLVSCPAVVGNILYVSSDVYLSSSGNWNDIIYALNAANGNQLWNYTTSYNSASSSANFGGVGAGGPSSSTIVNGVLYVGSYDGNVYALNATNGQKIWSYLTQGSVGSSPAFVNGVVYIGSGDGNVYALNAKNGARIWNYKTGYPVGSSPAVVNGVVYIGSCDGNVYALKAGDGDKLWNYTTHGTGLLPSKTYVNGTTVYFVLSSPAVVNGVVYVGSDDGNVYALNAKDGIKLWNYTTGDYIWSSPAVVGGVLYVPSDDSLYALNATDGSKLWSYTGGNGQQWNAESSPAAANGVVYFGAVGQIYALGGSTSTPAVPELSWLVILPLLLFMFSIAVTLRHRKTFNLKQ